MNLLRSKSLLIIILLLIGTAHTARRGYAGEILRIRVENKQGGTVAVSMEAGSYSAVGKVLRPASASIPGFNAADFIQSGTVAATAVHGIRIKTGEVKEEKYGTKPLMISLVPFEFATAPKGFGGHIPYESGIYTDIPAGKSIFRNLAPFVGNKVFLEKSGKLSPLPNNYSPAVDDVIVIAVTRPDRWLRELIFENRKMGKVIAVYQDGSSETVTTVEQPVYGVGRYDGTSYTGKGRINTNHPGVLTVSTAPVSTAALEGVGYERRGGFQIIPSYHALSQPTPCPQAMIVGPSKPKGPVVEGKKPLFCEYVGLSWDQTDDSHSYRVQIKIDDGKWEEVPEIVGKIDNAFTAAGLNTYFKNCGVSRNARKGVTHIRILFPSEDMEFIAAQLSEAVQAYRAALIPAPANSSGQGVIYGIHTLRPALTTVPYGTVVMFFVDGRCAKISAVAPYQYEWDTKNVPDGEHVIDIRAADVSGNIIKTTTLKLIVKNG